MKLRQTLQRAVDELGPRQAIAAVFLGTLILGPGADDRLRRVLPPDSPVHTAATADLLIEQACRIHDKSISDEIVRAGWRADTDL